MRPISLARGTLPVSLVPEHYHHCTVVAPSGPRYHSNSTLFLASHNHRICVLLSPGGTVNENKHLIYAYTSHFPLVLLSFLIPWQVDQRRWDHERREQELYVRTPHPAMSALRADCD